MSEFRRDQLDAESFAQVFDHRAHLFGEYFVRYPSGRARVQRIPAEVVIADVYRNSRKTVPLHFNVHFEGLPLALSLPALSLDALDALVEKAVAQAAEQPQGKTK